MNKCNIVCAIDDSYAQHLAVLMISLIDKNKSREFSFYILNDYISSETCEKLNSILRGTHHEISYISVDMSDYKSCPVGQWNKIMYLKLLTPGLLPASVERYLFLDVDVIVNSDIGELYDEPFGDAEIIACEDIPDCIEHKKRLGLPHEWPYINSGVMLVNLQQWRKRDVDCFSYMRSKNIKFINDQDVHACYFGGKIKILPIKWNMVTFYFMRKPKIFQSYLDQLKEGRKKPSIIHFACPIKPWYKDCQHPYAQLYRKYLSKTPWKDYSFPYYEKLGAYQRVKKKVRLFFNKIGLIRDDYYNVK